MLLKQTIPGIPSNLQKFDRSWVENEVKVTNFSKLVTKQTTSRYLGHNAKKE